MSRWHRKTQFIANEIALILQNIAAKRPITRQDIFRSVRLAYLSAFPGISMNGVKGCGYPLGYYPYTAVMYVKGVGQNLAQMKWLVKITNDNNDYIIYADTNTGSVCNLKFFTQPTDSGKFWPKFDISNNESKLIIQCLIAYDCFGKWGDKFSDGTYCKNVSSRKAFGFLFLEPKGVGTSSEGFFPATIIVKPNKGFSESWPQ